MVEEAAVVRGIWKAEEGVGDLAVGQIVVEVVGGKRVVVKGGSGGEQWDLVANYCSVCV